LNRFIEDHLKHKSDSISNMANFCENSLQKLKSNRESHRKYPPTKSEIEAIQVCFFFFSFK